MAITSNDLKTYKTLNNLGGAVTGAEIINNALHNVFPQVQSNEALFGLTDYACIYFKNGHNALLLANVIAFIANNTSSPTTEMAIGLGTSGLSGVEQTIVNRLTPPSGVVFTENVGEVNAITLPNVPFGGYVPIWIRRVIQAGTPAISQEGILITFAGDTEQ